MNTTTRLGKSARLPHSIREQLNLKLHDGIPAKSVLPWLNGLPEVQAILAADFDNRPVNKQNLSEWKHGGFRDWLLHFQAANFLHFIPDTDSNAQTALTLSPSDGERDRGEGPATMSAPPSHSALRRCPDRVGQDSALAKLLLWTQLQYISMARHIDSESDPTANGLPSANLPPTSLASAAHPSPTISSKSNATGSPSPNPT